MKNVFFISSQIKTLLFLRYLNLCPDLFGHMGKSLDEKVKVNFKLYKVTT